MSIIKHLLSGMDNATVDIGRVSWAGSFLAVCIASAANVWHGLAIDLQALSIALSAIAGSHGAALWAKRDTEPAAPPADLEMPPK